MREAERREKRPRGSRLPGLGRRIPRADGLMLLSPDTVLLQSKKRDMRMKKTTCVDVKASKIGETNKKKGG